MKRVTRLAAAGAAASLLATSLAACGAQRTSADSEGSTGAVALTPAETQALADRLYTTIYGDAVGRAAQDYLTWHAYQAPIIACMANVGYAYEPEYVSHVKGIALSGTAGTTWLGDPNRSVVLQETRRGAVSDRRLEARERATPAPGTVESSAEYQRELSKCTGLAREPGQESLPAGANTLLLKFNNVLDGVDVDLASGSEYKHCMNDEGVDLREEEDDGYQALTWFLIDRRPPAQLVPAGKESPSPEWKAFVDTEGKAMAADRACRLTTYEAGMEQLAPLLQQFSDDNAAELDAVAAAWVTMLASAKAQGWSARAGSSADANHVVPS